MVVIIFSLLGIWSVAALKLFTMATAYRLSNDDFWLDEPSALVAGDQAVVDSALLLHALEQNETQTVDHEKKMQLRQQIKQECGHLVTTIMSINALDPLEPAPCNKVVNIADYS